MAEIITTGRARWLLKNYMDKYGINADNKNENIAVWFPASLIFELFTSTLYEDKKIPNGIQIYFGSYSNDPAKQQKNTVILVPTYDKNGITTDILENPDACPGELPWHEVNEGQGNPPPDPDGTPVNAKGQFYNLGLARFPDCKDLED